MASCQYPDLPFDFLNLLVNQNQLKIHRKMKNNESANLPIPHFLKERSSIRALELHLGRSDCVCNRLIFLPKHVFTQNRKTKQNHFEEKLFGYLIEVSPSHLF